MKIYHTLFLAFLFLLAADNFTESKVFQSKKERHIGLAFELEFEKTRDTKTNTIPSERLFAAKVFADQKRQQKSIANINWEERGPNNVGGRTRTLMYDLNDPSGNTVFAGSVGGGLWRTTNINATPTNWQPIDDFWSNIAISTIAQNPANPNEIYVGTGEGWFVGGAIRGNGIWKSDDAGNTWKQLPSTKGTGYVNKIVIGQNGIALSAIRNVFSNTGGIFRSDDGGNLWKPVLVTSESFSMGADIEVAANGDIYASMGVRYSDGIYKSTDNGLSWTKVYQSKPNEFRIELACASSNPDIVYALLENNEEDGIPSIKKTVNGGVLWQDLNTPLWYDQNCSQLSRDWTRGQDWFDLIAMVDPSDADAVFIGAVDLFKTTNGGNSWTQISHWYTNSSCNFPPQRVVHADQHAMAFKPGSSSEILFGHDGGVSRTTNANTFNPENIRFVSKSDNYNVTQFYATATSNEEEGNRFLAGAQDNGTQYYRTLGMNSTREVTGGDGAYCHIDTDNSNIQISSYTYNSYFITNNAWSNVVSIREGRTGRFINPTDYDSETNTLYAAHDAGQYFYIKNVGTSNITGTEEIDGMSGIISAVTVSPNTTNKVFFASSRGELVKIENINAGFFATTIEISNGLPSGYISSIAVENGNDNHLLISYSNYGKVSIWETKNEGINWTNVEGDLPDMPVRWAEFNPQNNNSALLATELGVWTTEGLEGTNTIWNPSNNGLANVRVNMLQFRPSDNFLIAATMGRGLFSSSSFTGSNQEKADLTCADLGNVSMDTTRIAVRDVIIKNEGSLAVEEDFEVSFYLSKDNSFTSSDLLVYTTTINGLAIGASTNLSFDIDRQSFQLPEADYYIGYRIDSENQVEELDEADNVCYWENPQLTLGTSSCESITLINCGETINSSNAGQLNHFTKENYSCYSGLSELEGRDKIYQITFTDNSDIEIHLTNLAENLDVFLLDGCETNSECFKIGRNSDTRDEIIRAFNLLGTYYIVVDGHQKNTENSFTLSVNCTNTQLGKPNLQVQSKGLLTIEGERLTISSTRIQNDGTGFAEPCSTGYYLSLDTIISTDDYLILPGKTRELPAGSSQTNSIFASTNNDNVPDGDYYVGIVLDTENILDETNELDNSCYWQSPKVKIGNINTDQPNLICDNLGILSLSGSFLNILNLSVKNIGTLKAEASYVGYYLSTDTIITADDIYLGESAVRALNPNSKSVEYFSERLSDIPAGSYYIGVVVDYREDISESTRVDNYYFYSKKYVSSGNDANTADMGSLIPINDSKQSTEDFHIAPNPSRGKFKILLQHPVNESFTIDIIDTGGKIIQKYSYPFNSDTTFNFNLEAFENGVYYIRLRYEEVSLSKKLLLLK